MLAPVCTGGGMRIEVLQALAAGKATVTPRGAEGLDVLEPDPPLNNSRRKQRGDAVSRLGERREAAS